MLYLFRYRHYKPSIRHGHSIYATAPQSSQTTPVIRLCPQLFPIIGNQKHSELIRHSAANVFPFFFFVEVGFFFSPLGLWWKWLSSVGQEKMSNGVILLSSAILSAWWWPVACLKDQWEAAASPEFTSCVLKPTGHRLYYCTKSKTLRLKKSKPH